MWKRSLIPTKDNQIKTQFGWFTIHDVRRLYLRRLLVPGSNIYKKWVSIPCHFHLSAYSLVRYYSKSSRHILCYEINNYTICTLILSVIRQILEVQNMFVLYNKRIKNCFMDVKQNILCNFYISRSYNIMAIIWNSTALDTFHNDNNTVGTYQENTDQNIVNILDSYHFLSSL